MLDDANLLVSATAERRYHMQLRRRATGLRTSWSIAFSSPTSRICSGFSELLVDDSFGIDRIRIESIRQLTDEEYENLLVRFGVASAKKEQVPAPEPVQGAEAEELD